MREASVPVWDRSFLMGEGIYEVVGVDAGRLVAWERHWQRLSASLSALGIACPLPSDELRRRLEELARRNAETPEGRAVPRICVYLQVSAGVSEAPGRDYLAPSAPLWVAFMFAAPALDAEPAELSVQLAQDIRWQRADIKATGLTAVGLLKRRAQAGGFHDAILHRDGQVNEATTSNVFAVIGGEICTPPLSHRLLPGVTRALLLDGLRQRGAQVAERAIPLDELRAAQEIWLTSTVQRIQPVAELDGEPLPQVRGDGFCQARQVLAQMQAAE